jgi:bifunctional N-acetylglucosamine-1-phosphate-uridyltransferase/glucosamine-1-phosphate-acetyltransferase GlmU-like protein
MEGLSKPFFKPLLEINGIPLVRYAVEYASIAGATKVTVVVSPHNGEAIAQALAQYADWISVAVQEEPLGPGHAALVGLRQVTDDKTMLLMSDNIMSIDSVQKMAFDCEMRNSDGVGVRMVSLDQASRFTRIRKLSKDSYTFVEGIEVSAEDIWPSRDKVVVWCGPVIFESDTATSVLRKAYKARKSDNAELKIGPYLSKIVRYPAVLTDVEAMDVGIPSAYLEKLGNS